MALLIYKVIYVSEVVSNTTLFIYCKSSEKVEKRNLLKHSVLSHGQGAKYLKTHEMRLRAI